jgi:hypothetical protein
MKFIAIVAAVLVSTTQANRVNQLMAENLFGFSAETKAIVGAAGKKIAQKNAAGNFS